MLRLDIRRNLRPSSNFDAVLLWQKLNGYFFSLDKSKLKPFCVLKHEFLLNFWITHRISNPNLTWRIYTGLYNFAIAVLLN